MRATRIPEVVGDVDGRTSYRDILIRAKHEVADSPSEKADLLRSMGEARRRTGDIATALRDVRQARDIYQRLNQLNGLAWSTWSIATIYRQQARYSDAVIAFQKAAHLAAQVGDGTCGLYSEAGIAETTRIQGDYGRAYPHHASILAVCGRTRDARGIVWALEGMAQMLKNTGRPDLALTLFERALRIASSTFDYRGLAYALKGCAETRASLGEIGESMSLFQRALELFQYLGMNSGLAYTRKSLAEVLAGKGDTDEARRELVAAESLFITTGDARGLLYTRLAEAEVKLREGRPDPDLTHWVHGGFNDLGIWFGSHKAQVLERGPR